MSPASPSSPVPALLATQTRSRTPVSRKAFSSSTGSPTAPKPEHSTVAPSLMPATASARDFTRLSIMGGPSLPRPDLGHARIQFLPRPSPPALAGGESRVRGGILCDERRRGGPETPSPYPLPHFVGARGN